MAGSMVGIRFPSALLLGSLAAVAALGCRQDAPQPLEAPAASEPPAETQIAADPAALSAAADEPAPAAEPSPAPLPVPGFRDAVLVAPTGAAAPRPVLVAVHGMYDRVEPFCAAWSRIAAGWPYVLCPRGQPRLDAGLQADRWTFGWRVRDLDREIDAGLKALRERYGEQVADGPVVFAGFSLGAILGADVVLWNPSRYSRAVLVEGGTTNWSLTTAKRFARRGGKKLLFACGQEMCLKETRAGLYWLDVAGVDARTAYAGTIGHTYEGIVAEELTRTWGWLTEGDARWPAGSQPGPLASRAAR
jgi:hypothetical protein